MNINNILTADVLDILFDDRNKAYGAYDLRKTYNGRISKALGAVGLLCLLLCVGTIFAKDEKVSFVPVVSTVILEKYEPNKPEPVVPKEEIKPQAVEPVKTQAFTVPQIVVEADPKDIPPTIDQLENVKIGSITTDGKDFDGTVSAPVVDAKGTGNTEEIGPKEPDYTVEFKTVQIEAEFPGGRDAWKKYLERNLNTQTPTDNGAASGKYSVIVSFIVDREGNVSDVKAENNPGYGTAEEAVRIIKKSHTWKPAQQNGRFVTYRMRQQITFQVSED